MPDPDSPDADAWDAAVAGQMAAIGEDFVAAGHSLGASTILRAIALHGAPPNLLGVVTLAMPFWNAPDWEVPDYALPDDVGPLVGVPLSLWFSTDDETVAIDHLGRYHALLPHAKTRRISGTGHLFDHAPFDEIARDIVALAERDR